MYPHSKRLVTILVGIYGNLYRIRYNNLFLPTKVAPALPLKYVVGVRLQRYGVFLNYARNRAENVIKQKKIGLNVRKLYNNSKFLDKNFAV